MVRTNNYTTLLLIIIVTMLFIGLGITIYYVLDLDWFSKEPVQIYNEVYTDRQEENIQIKIEKEIAYDVQKRTYNILLNTDEFNVVVYKDGTVGLTMLENEKYKQIVSYDSLLNREIRSDLTNIIRAYEVKVAKNEALNNYIVLLDNNGNLYELDQQELRISGKYVFKKIEGLAKIIDVRQITNEGLTENVTGVNAIAIDNNSNELLLTDYLISSND